MIYILKNHSSSAKHIKNAAPFPPQLHFHCSLFDAGYTTRDIIAYMIMLNLKI